MAIKRSNGGLYYMSIFISLPVQSICLPKAARGEPSSSTQVREVESTAPVQQKDDISLSPNSIAIREMAIRYQDLEMYEVAYKYGKVIVPAAEVLTGISLLYIFGLTIITGAAAFTAFALAAGSYYLLNKHSYLSGIERSIVLDKMISTLKKITSSAREPLIKYIEENLGKPIADKIRKELKVGKT